MDGYESFRVPASKFHQGSGTWLVDIANVAWHESCELSSPSGSTGQGPWKLARRASLGCSGFREIQLLASCPRPVQRETGLLIKTFQGPSAWPALSICQLPHFPWRSERHLR